MLSKNLNKLPIDPAWLLPHRAPMLLLDRITNFGPGWLEAQVAHENSPFKTSEGIPAWVSIEYMAQAICAYAGISCRQRQVPPKIAFLLGTRLFSSTVTHFSANEILLVRVEAIMEDNSGISLFHSQVLSTGNTLQAEAQIKGIMPEDTADFIRKTQ